MNTNYESPFSSRYASSDMQYLFSEDKKFKTWRRLWVVLAEAEKELGINITDEQISELKMFEEDINIDVAKKREKEVRHDVMSHIYAYGKQCEKAKPIIHLGATSCYVGDNTDLLIMFEALSLIKRKLINVINSLSKFAYKYKDMPTLGFTHFQPAQLTTVGKRACLWLHDLVLDFQDLNYRLDNFKLLGCKGTTGTQASFLELFEGNVNKVKKLDRVIAKKLGFENIFEVSGQTYSRKVDFHVLSLLSSIAQSAYKFSNDLRILQGLKEIEEPFETNQVGSSAMPYKRNPMRLERISSIARYVLVTELNTAITSSTQWFERTLDDSANRRISVSEAFLAVDGILDIYFNVADGLLVYPKIIMKRINEELPFMATENIMMSAVKKGGDRQELHERIRKHSLAASKRVKQDGLDNDLVKRIAEDSSFGLTREEIEGILKAENFIGISKEQTEYFIENIVNPIIKKNEELLSSVTELKV